MTPTPSRPAPRWAWLLFALLDPIPYGAFVAALIFDAIYYNTATIMYVKGAAWLLVFGLLAAIIPRLINLFLTWMPRYRASAATRLDFMFTALAIIAAIFNAFVHGRDAFAAMPTGLWLSILTVVLLVLGRLAGNACGPKGEDRHV
ncbi:hypothetical protein [Carnimonas nigrificans]|uniref:hypothetical protein n=1 Tax=Carnimonas nigrificans TaxID=64323 RepID=UPI0004714D26|nr:hypothetical protein [Carnimonas nigrificans]